MAVEQITPTRLKEWLDQSDGGTRPQPLLIDVREPWELDICRLAPARSMPMRSVPLRLAEMDREEDIVVICHHGARSFQVAMFLELQGFSKLYNLEGGIAAWARQIDPNMPKY